MPQEYRRYGEGWKQLHPSWRFIEWDEASIETLPLLNRDLYIHAERYTANVGQFRSDIARLAILWHYGGVYVDCDFEPRKPIDELIQDTDLFAAWEQEGIWINNAILGARLAHPFIAELIDGLRANVAAHPGRKPNVMTGPQYLTRMWRHHQPIGVIAPQKHFYPYSWNQLDRENDEFPDAYAVHRWGNKSGRSAGTHHPRRGPQAR